MTEGQELVLELASIIDPGKLYNDETSYTVNAIMDILVNSSLGAILGAQQLAPSEIQYITT